MNTKSYFFFEKQNKTNAEYIIVLFEIKVTKIG